MVAQAVDLLRNGGKLKFSWAPENRWFWRWQLVKQYGQLPCYRHDRPFFGIRPSSFSQLQSPAPQITVFSKACQNVVRALHQHRSLITVALLADV
jgi:hypothetical protein